LSAGFRPDPLEELTAFPRPLAGSRWKGGGKEDRMAGEAGKGMGGKGRGERREGEGRQGGCDGYPPRMKILATALPMVATLS